MNSIVIHHHLGLGDHIDCNGMVRYFSELYNENMIQIFSKPQYFEMIEYMYRDNDRINVNLVHNEYQGVTDFLFENKSTVDDFLELDMNIIRQIHPTIKIVGSISMNN